MMNNIIRRTRRPLRAIATKIAILSQRVGSILIGLFTCMWLDLEIESTPFFIVLFICIGLKDKP